MIRNRIAQLLSPARGLALLILLAESCTSVPPVDCTNPFDPDCGNPPETYLDTSPAEGSIVKTDTVRFTWHGSENVSRYKYRLTRSRWSDWIDSEDSSITFFNPGEGLHVFEVKSLYSEEYQDDTPESRSFAVKALVGPRLRFDQRSYLTSKDSVLKLVILLGQINDVKGVRLNIGFSLDRFKFVSAQIYEDVSSALLGNGGEILLFEPPKIDLTRGTVTMEFATVSGTPPTVNIGEDGPIAEIELVPLVAGTGGEALVSGVRFLIGTGGTEIRDGTNNAIDIGQNMIDAIIDIRP